jgi:hypothetical protein
LFKIKHLVKSRIKIKTQTSYFWLSLLLILAFCPANCLLNIYYYFILIHEKMYSLSWASMSDTCNPTLLRGWIGEDCSLRPAWANNQSKMELEATLGVWSPEFKLQSHSPKTERNV